MYACGLRVIVWLAPFLVFLSNFEVYVDRTVNVRVNDGMDSQQQRAILQRGRERLCTNTHTIQITKRVRQPASEAKQGVKERRQSKRAKQHRTKYRWLISALYKI